MVSLPAGGDTGCVLQEAAGQDQRASFLICLQQLTELLSEKSTCFSEIRRLQALP